MIYLVISLLVVGFVFDAERDTIRFRPNQSWFPYSDYWTKLNWKKPWLVKLFPIWDGWHICKFIFMLCMYSAMVILYLGDNAIWYQYIAYVLYLNFLYGAVFESSYGNEIF